VPRSTFIAFSSALVLQTPALPPRTAIPGAEVLVEVARVVDGDTLEVVLEGRTVTLRLLSVDTEEKIAGRAALDATKPETVFGEETAQWARAFFARLGEPARVGLAFPEGRVEDAYGRLLCHVLLPDGRDFNLLLVAEGRSPYFNKYGNSLRAHAAFVAAQAAAREARVGIWNPETNRARTPGAPSAVRPYAELLPWWQARAEAIDAFRARATGDPWLVAAEDAQALARLEERARADPAARVTVFGTVDRVFDETDGSWSVLLRSRPERASLRVAVGGAERAEIEPLVRSTLGEYRQNYLYVSGRLGRNQRGFVLTGTTRADWRVAEPAHPAGEAR
jgi:micrococcal nuclease